jgi:hypothetical protein
MPLPAIRGQLCPQPVAVLLGRGWWPVVDAGAAAVAATMVVPA